jgi:hypothetical protein
MAIHPERNPADLDPILRHKWEAGLALYRTKYPERPVPFLTQCYRSNETQAAYHAQGRKSLAEVNRLRAAAGHGAITAAQNKIITKALPGSSPHNRKPAMAFDVAFLDPINPRALSNDLKNYTLFAACMVEVDPDDVVEWGGEWKFVDRPHFQRRNWRKL